MRFGSALDPRLRGGERPYSAPTSRPLVPAQAGIQDHIAMRFASTLDAVSRDTIFQPLQPPPPAWCSWRKNTRSVPSSIPVPGGPAVSKVLTPDMAGTRPLAMLYTKHERSSFLGNITSASTERYVSEATAEASDAALFDRRTAILAANRDVLERCLAALLEKEVSNEDELRDLACDLRSPSAPAGALPAVTSAQAARS
jgi:hypothetical protein